MTFSRRLSTALLTVLAVTLTTAGLTLVLSSTAQAHSALVSSSPADGAALDEAPTEIVLEFNEDMQAIGTEVVVVDPEGTPLAQGEVVIDGPTLTQAIGTGAAGTYTVTWRAVSADGHPISGEYAYTLTVAPTTEPTTDATTEGTGEATITEASTEAVAPSSADADADADDAGSDAAVPIMIGLAVLVLVGVVILVVRRRRAR